MADLIMLNTNDPTISGIQIAILAQADDILFILLLAKGLQRRLNALNVWCSLNFIKVNIIKTITMIFGPAPANPMFNLGENTLIVKTEEKYFSMHF
jgi:hypothetical protein